MNNTKTPFDRNLQLPKIGGFRYLRLAYSKDVIQQELQTKNEIETLIFPRGENWLGGWGFEDDFVGDLKVDYTINENAGNEKHTFKAVLEVDVPPDQFSDWFERKIKGRRLVVELTSNNGFVRRLNPYFLTYTYIANQGFGDINRYELSFEKAKQIDYALDIIQDIHFQIVQYNHAALQQNLNSTVLTYSDPNLYDFLSSGKPDIDTATLEDSNVLLFKNYGYYFVFVRLKGTDIYQKAFVQFANSYTDLKLL